MRLCLIRCPSPFLIDERIFPPLGLLAVGTALKLRGHDVTIYDGELENIPLDYNFYGFGPTIAEYGYAKEAKDKIREYTKKAWIVIGGPYATLNPQQCIDDDFDCIVTGDGEIEAERAFLETTPQTLIHAEEHPLDDYPMIDRTLLNHDHYHYYLNGIRATTIMTSQGCPYKCAFCCKNYKSVRYKSVGRVIEEITELHDVFGYKALAFPEDLFILNRKRTEEICACLKKLGILWRCLVRGDFIVKYGEEFVQMMADSGCVDVRMGIESGSNKILKIVNKGENTDTLLKAIKMLQNVGIRVKGFFIIGLPGEDYSTIAETKKFLAEANLYDIDIKIFQPYLGTPIWENREKYDIQWDDGLDFEKLFYKGKIGEYYGNVRTSSLTTEQIYKEWVQIETKYKEKFLCQT